MNQFFYNMTKTYWALKHVSFVFNYNARWRKTKVIRILKRHNQLNETLNLFSKIVNEKFASSISYNKFNLSKQSQKYSMKM